MTSTSSIFTSKIVWDQPPGQLLQQLVYITKEFLHKLSETVSGKLICMLVVLIGVSAWLEFAVVINLSGQMLIFNGVWHFGEVFSSRMNPGFHCTGQMTDSLYGIVSVSGLLLLTLWIEWPIVAVGLWYGQAYVVDNKHRCILLMAFWMHRDTVTRSWGPLLCHSSITSCCSMIMHGPMRQRSVHDSWTLKTSQVLHGQHNHRTCHPLSMFGMLWIGIYDSVFQFLPISSNFTQTLKRSDQHPTDHNQQPDQLYVKEMCCTAWSKWWSHQILTGFRTTPPPPPNTVKLQILECPFIVASLRHTCAIIMLSNQHLDMTHLWGGWIISFTNTDLDRFVNNIWEK